MNSALYCSNCGRANSPDRATCKRCGASLSSASTEKPVNLQQANVSANESFATIPLSSEYEYLAVPFVGRLNRGVFNVDNAYKVTQQLQEVITKHGQQGWDFYRVDKVNIQVSPGCLASLLGAQVSFVTFDQVVFRKAIKK